MVVEFDPTALARPPRPPRRWLPSPRAFAIGLMVTGVLTMIALGIWIAKHPLLASIPLRWGVRLHAGVEADPLVIGDMLIIGSMDGTLWGLDAASGQRLYRRATAVLGIGGGLVEHDGLIYFGSDDHCIYAVDPHTGDTVASARTNGPVRASPVVVGDRVVVGSDDGYVWTFRVGTLEPASEPFPAGSPIAGDPCVYEGRVIFCPLAGGLYLLDPATGDHQFADVPGPICSGPAVTISGNVWVGNDLGDVYVVEIETLAVEHVARLPQPVRGGFLEQAGRVYVGGNDGSLQVFRSRPPGPMRELAAGGAVRARPEHAAGVVYWASDDGVLHACDLEGRALAEERVGGARIASRPAVSSSGILYVCDAAGRVRAYSLLGTEGSDEDRP